MENLTHSIRGDKTGCSSLRLEDIFVNISNLMHLFSFSLAGQSLSWLTRRREKEVESLAEQEAELTGKCTSNFMVVGNWRIKNIESRMITLVTLTLTRRKFANSGKLQSRKLRNTQLHDQIRWAASGFLTGRQWKGKASTFKHKHLHLLFKQNIKDFLSKGTWDGDQEEAIDEREARYDVKLSSP